MLAVLAPLLLLVVDVDLGPAQVAVVVVCFVGMLLFDMVHASNLVFLESSSRFTTMRMLDIGALYLWLLIAAVAIANGAGVVQLAFLSLAQSIVSPQSLQLQRADSTLAWAQTAESSGKKLSGPFG